MTFCLVPMIFFPHAVEMPETDGGDLLLSNDFVRYCLDMFSVPSKGGDSNSRTFLRKHLNIIDPLKENNNLGRSVSQGKRSLEHILYPLCYCSIILMVINGLYAGIRYGISINTIRHAVFLRYRGRVRLNSIEQFASYQKKVNRTFCRP